MMLMIQPCDHDLYIIFFEYWRKATATQKEERLTEDRRKRNVEAVRHERVEYMNQRVMSMLQDTTGSVGMRLIMRGWRTFVMEERVQQARDRDAKRREDVSNDFKNKTRVYAKALFLIGGGDGHTVLSSCFSSWRIYVAYSIQKRIESLRPPFNAWHAVAKSTHRQRELTKGREELAEREREHESELKKGRTRRATSS
ncbi:unnamed protein product [Prorocentrum cordatum]|uniref:Uncharacterized protein n=1 Tax=Prorocentrum cordatum TaxID=2364126 RepID=A0ABN9R8W9_9DINO|nr:unnamed protein product [Polarella glacialis]